MKGMRTIGLLAAALAVAFSAAAEDLGWYDMIKIKGDLRYRIESFQTEDANAKSIYTYRDRQRIRVRVGLEAAIDDYWMTEIGLATSEIAKTGADPVSTNQTLGDMYTKKSIWVDLAYIRYKVLFENAMLYAGKMKNPFTRVGGSQIIWDGDLTPEGIAGDAKYTLLPDLKLFATAGGFWVRESSASFDPMVYGGQLGADLKFMETKLKLGAGYFHYIDITKQAAYDPAGGTKAFGNTLVGGKYANNFMMGEIFLDYGFDVLGLPVSTYCDWVLNNGANRFNRAYIIGLGLNKAKGQGTWAAGYNYRMIQKDSVVGAFSDSDFIGGGTNGEGHQISASYVPFDKVTTSLTFFRNSTKLDGSVRPFYNRFQADLIVAF